MTHKHKFYPTGEKKYFNIYDQQNERILTTIYLNEADIPKLYKFICVCGKTKWIREKQ